MAIASGTDDGPSEGGVDFFPTLAYDFGDLLVLLLDWKYRMGV